jgi:hypothetical protein
MSVSAADHLAVASTEAAAPSRSFTSRLLLALILGMELVWVAFLVYLAVELMVPPL